MLYCARAYASQGRRSTKVASAQGMLGSRNLAGRVARSSQVVESARGGQESFGSRAAAGGAAQNAGGWPEPPAAAWGSPAQHMSARTLGQASSHQSQARASACMRANCQRRRCRAPSDPKPRSTSFFRSSVVWHSNSLPPHGSKQDVAAVARQLCVCCLGGWQGATGSTDMAGWRRWLDREGVRTRALCLLA